MSVTLNTAALDFLLRNPAGPVGRDLERRAEKVTAIYRTNVRNIMPQFSEDSVGYEIMVGDDGLLAIIGIRGGSDSDRWARYLAQKVEKEPEKAVGAIQQGFHV